MLMIPGIVEALDFATEMHEGQTRKYNGGAYIEHPIAVADLVEAYLDEQGTEESVVQMAIQIAILHDTVEDTPATEENIVERFSKEVAEGVWYLTKTPSFVGNRAVRKELCQARLAAAPWVIKVIKTFDMMHNATTIEANDANFWVVFKEETIALLEAMGTTHIWKEQKGTSLV
jgi:(p)ppGpp synthase/HD superfamily hydrolase|tara:strand:+ start:2245 stop:2766 length:522 start_codon:yes stop_codon:yes gene_type:complete